MIRRPYKTYGNGFGDRVPDPTLEEIEERKKEVRAMRAELDLKRTRWPDKESTIRVVNCGEVFSQQLGAKPTFYDFED